MSAPPYANITGIYTTDDKHHSISRAAYNGSAKPGQIVVDTADYSLWVGTNTGNLIAAGGGGGGGGGSATPAGADTQVQFNNAGAFGGAAGFTFNSTTGVLTAPKLAGNGASLTGLVAANIVGTVATATNAATANAVAGANVTGAVAFATTANSVAIANVVGAGNIAVLNLNGDGTKVLAGNGAWVTPSGGSLPNGQNLEDSLYWTGTAWTVAPTTNVWNFPSAADDAAYVAFLATRGYTSLNAGGRYYNTTTKKLRTYDGTVWADVDSGGGTTSTQDLSLALTGPAIDVTLAGYFYYTATTNVTLSVTNVPTTANVVTSFILEIKNGSTRITWWPNITWAGGVVPTLTTTGTDSIAFYSYNDAGTVKWRGLPLAFDIR